MATGFPVKANYATGDILTATNMNDLSGTLNSITTETLSLSAGKNALINGGFDIWQRGTTSTTNGAFLADRWYDYMATGTGTYAQESTVVPSGSRYAMKFTASASATPQILQAIETANAIRFAGKTVTLSGQFAASTSTQINLILEYSTSVDTALLGSWTQISVSSGTGNATPTSTTYVQASGTYAIPSTAKSLRVTVSPNAAIANTVVVYYGQIQLELGSTATTFSRAGGTIQGELTNCQRYYARLGGTTQGAAYANFGIGVAHSTTVFRTTIYSPTTMRIAPSVSISGAITTSTQGLAVSGLTGVGGSQTTTSGSFDSTGTGFTQYRPDTLVANNSTATYIEMSSEL